MIIVDEFARAHKPVFHEFFRGLAVDGIEILRVGHGGPIEVVAVRVLRHIAIKLFAVAHEEPVLNAVRGYPKRHALRFHGRFQLADYIALRSHLVSVPVRNI